MTESCLFCRIVAGELPSERLYEDEEFVVILDLHPVQFGHALILPRTHKEHLLAADVHTLEKILPLAQKVARAIISATGASGFNLLLNNGRISGQLIDHLHFHIIPRQEGDGLKHWPGQVYGDGAMKSMGEKIRKALI